MNIIKKIGEVITGYNKKEVEMAEVYVVSWCARYGHYCNDWNRVAKAFLSKEDANVFAASLAEAAKLLQYSECIDIKVEKQK